MNPTLQGVKQRFGIIGNSQALNHAIQIAMRVAPTDLSVLINGESGVERKLFQKSFINSPQESMKNSLR